MKTYSKSTIVQYRSRHNRLQLALESGQYTPDEETLIKIEMMDIAAKIGLEALKPPERGRPRLKMVLRGEELLEYERMQREGLLKQVVDYSPAATLARAKLRLTTITPETVTQSAVALEQLQQIAEEEKEKKEAKEKWESQQKGKKNV